MHLGWCMMHWQPMRTWHTNNWRAHDALTGQPMSTWCTSNQLRSRHNHQLSITYYRCTSEPWAMSCIKTRNSLHLKQSSRSCAHQPDMRAGCIDCHLLSEHNRWLSIKNLMQFNARGDAFHQHASPDLAHWWWWLGICFGPEYAVMLSSTGHVLIWSHSIIKVLTKLRKHGEHICRNCEYLQPFH